MANHHFAKFGDVWKHLPLLEVLNTEPAASYWETHAGSADYPLTRTLSREYGVYTFMQVAHRSPALAKSVYCKRLEALPLVDGGPVKYPGSALFAMMQLGSESSFLFCDVDGASIASLEAASRRLDLEARCLHADGLSAVWQELRAYNGDPHAVVVHIDPFDPFTAGAENGPSAAELARRLATSGIRVVYWYGYDAPNHRAWAWAEVAHEGQLAPAWCGDILLCEDADAAGQPMGRFATGCGVLLLNWDTQSTVRASRLGRDLAAAYDGVPLPSGKVGHPDFTEFTSMTLPGDGAGKVFK
jgi:hypothetical protein